MQESLFQEPQAGTLRPLRERQLRAIEAIRQAVRDGHRRIIVQAPCGWGKTIVAAHMITGSLAKGRRSLFTVPALSLIEQTIERFQNEGIRDLGVIQAQHLLTDWNAAVQIASIQTLIRRALPEVDFILCDEIHIQFKGMLERLDSEAWANKLVIGLTATPWVKGMGNRWKKLIIPATISELIEEGLLTSTDLYIPEEVADRNNVKMDKGEFTEESASKEMRQQRIVGNVVDTWKRLGPGEKTFLFCVNREHAKEQMGAFVDSGIPFGYIDKNTTLEDRKLAFDQMRYGEIAGIASVGCLIAGVDQDVRCVIDAALTNSEIRLVQKWGRGIRTAPGKEKLIGLDHAGNNSEAGLGLFWEIFHDHLDTRKPSEKGKAYEGEPHPAKPKRCTSCGLLIPAGRAVCACGTPLSARSDVEHAEGDLVLIGSGPKPKKKTKAEEIDKVLFYSGLLGYAQEKGYKPGWAFWKYKEKFGSDPDSRPVPTTPTYTVRNYIKYLNIKAAKGKAKAAV